LIGQTLQKKEVTLDTYFLSVIGSAQLPSKLDDSAEGHLGNLSVVQLASVADTQALACRHDPTREVSLPKYETKHIIPAVPVTAVVPTAIITQKSFPESRKPRQSDVIINHIANFSEGAIPDLHNFEFKKNTPKNSA
jgi:hypothetical protein